MAETPSKPSLKRKLFGPVGRTLAGLSMLGGGLYAAQGYRDEARKDAQTMGMYQRAEDQDLRNESYQADKLNEANEKSATLQEQLIEAHTQGDTAKKKQIIDDISFYDELAKIRSQNIESDRKDVQNLQPLLSAEQDKIDSNTNTANLLTFGGLAAAAAGIGSNFIKRKRKPGEIIRYNFTESMYADKAMEDIGRELNSMGFNLDFKETEEYGRRVYPVIHAKSGKEVALLELNLLRAPYIELEAGLSTDRDYFKTVLDINAKMNQGEKARVSRHR